MQNSKFKFGDFSPLLWQMPKGPCQGKAYLIFKVTNVKAQSKIETIKNRITILVSNNPFFW